jgi:hypothetical protein
MARDFEDMHRGACTELAEQLANWRDKVHVAGRPRNAQGSVDGIFRVDKKTNGWKDI